MHRRGEDNALRHIDFTVIDILLMQFGFMLMYWATGHKGIIYLDPVYRIQAVIFFSGQMALGLFSDCYDGILSRDMHEEFIVMLRYFFEVWLLCGVFVILANIRAKLPQLLMATLFYFDLAFFGRAFNKFLHRRRRTDRRHVLVVTSSDQVRKAILKINHSGAADDHEIMGICLTDDADLKQFSDLRVPVLYITDPNLLPTLTKWWIDDVFVLSTEKGGYPMELMEDFLTMGMTIHYSLSVLDDFNYAKTDVDRLGDYKVITNSTHFITDRAAFVKRSMDILGGLAGSFVTILLALVIGPAIYIKSPGPIFFKQKRVGLNGKFFYMYKFRSMYLDAEERKAELMAQNKIKDGMMFKMDDDPRIIGSEKKGKDGKPKGIGNFIRNTSIDEFPQFFNVLKGDMSLVGTRPPTIDEWNNYAPRHRARMAVKPGITGMWQVSGRSKITDFEQVVALDKKYLENWSPLLDIRILLKTVKVVLNHDGES